MVVALPVLPLESASRRTALSMVSLLAVLSATDASRAGTQQLPQWDVDATCHRQIGPSADDLRNRLNLNQCVESEQSSYEFLKDSWSLSSDAIQARCLSLQQNGPIRKYSALATCLSALSLSNGDDSVPPAHFRP